MKKIILWNHRTTHYSVLDSIDEVEKLIDSKPENERTYSEVILGWRPQKLRFDIDDATVKDLEIILSEVKKAWKIATFLDVNRFKTKPRILVFQTDEGITKNGYHLLINYFVKNAEISNKFNKLVITLLSEKGEKKVASTLDNIYGSNQNMRLMGCYKYGNGVLGKFKKRALSRNVTMKDSLISMVI